ncbi:unnamed protein product [Trichogramma brassicae]|uniref:Uncharacterized protein n=1 Tax=Trichogramma brassicae TaxID=86971 RepID=A0A6H5HZN6_9HYME|nr:unnamed protein product [Trichogramma brassicae]
MQESKSSKLHDDDDDEIEKCRQERQPFSQWQVPRIKTIVPKSDIVEIRVDDEEAKYISKSESELCSTNNNNNSNKDSPINASTPKVANLSLDLSSDSNGKCGTGMKTSPSNVGSSSRRSEDDSTEESVGVNSTSAPRSVPQKRACAKRGKEQLNQSFCGEFLKVHFLRLVTFERMVDYNSNRPIQYVSCTRSSHGIVHKSPIVTISKFNMVDNKMAPQFEIDCITLCSTPGSTIILTFSVSTNDSPRETITASGAEKEKMSKRAYEYKNNDSIINKFLYAPEKKLPQMQEGNSRQGVRRRGRIVEQQHQRSDFMQREIQVHVLLQQKSFARGLDLWIDESEISGPKDKRTVEDSELERFRGGNDEWNALGSAFRQKSTIGDETRSSLVAADFIENFKHLKIEKLRDGLERLKIRNRDLQGFLRNLQQPIDDDDEEATTVCTRSVSSSNTTCTSNATTTVDARRTTTRSSSQLLSSVRALESDCRNKDAIIAALAEELKRDVAKESKVRGFQVDGGKDREGVARFTKMDSAVGFFVIALILVSHVQRSELVLYLRQSRMILQSSFDGSVRLSGALWELLQEKSTELYEHYALRAALLSNEILSSSEKLFTASRVARLWRFLEPKTDLIFCMYTLASLALAIVVVGRRRRFLCNYASSMPRCKLLLTLYQFFCALLKIVEERIYSSKLFWLLLGFCTHALLFNLLYFKDDLRKLVHGFGLYCQRDHHHHHNHKQRIVQLSKDRVSPSGIGNESYYSSLWSLACFYLSKFNDELQPLVNYVSRGFKRYF